MDAVLIIFVSIPVPAGPDCEGAIGSGAAPPAYDIFASVERTPLSATVVGEFSERLVHPAAATMTMHTMRSAMTLKFISNHRFAKYKSQALTAVLLVVI
jgi:hypothetical protein